MCTRTPGYVRVPKLDPQSSCCWMLDPELCIHNHTEHVHGPAAYLLLAEVTRVQVHCKESKWCTKGQRTVSVGRGTSSEGWTRPPQTRIGRSLRLHRANSLKSNELSQPTLAAPNLAWSRLHWHSPTRSNVPV